MGGSACWDPDVFNQNVAELIEERCGGRKNRFNELIGQRDADYRWKSGQMPSLAAVIKICEHFKISYDWLLRGKSPEIPEEGVGLEMSENKELLDHYKELVNTLKEELREVRAELKRFRAESESPLAGTGAANAT